MTLGNLSRLEKLVDQLLIEMNGSDNVVMFLELVLDSEVEIKDRISKYITLAVANYFKISISELIDEGQRGRDEASYRIICYRLHKDILHCSIRETGRIYKRKENAIFMGIKRINEIEADPRIDIKIYEAFMKVKEHTLKFSNFLRENKKQEDEKAKKS
jgi:chromosomal replication initiation ATPase DnaA